MGRGLCGRGELGEIVEVGVGEMDPERERREKDRFCRLALVPGLEADDKRLAEEEARPALAVASA